MKYLVLTLILTSFSISCSQKFKHKVSKKATYSKNEFLFIGETQVVSDYLKENKVKFQIETLSSAKGSMTPQVVKFESKLPVEKIIGDLSTQVTLIQPNYEYNLVSTEDTYEWPKDRFFFRQWAVNNIGQSPPYGLPGRKNADINITQAWKEFGKGDPSNPVVVAVIDTGVNYNHPDFKRKGEEANIWTNTKELNGIPGVDDDGNGYTDDIHGYDFSSDTADGPRKELHYGQLGDPDPDDTSGHGTHCAGVIGAKGDNQIGIVGVMQHVKIMPLKIFGSGGASTSSSYRAILYAAEKEVDIISASWGGGAKDDILRLAIAEAGKKGVLFVAASGNDSTNNDVRRQYPSSYKELYDGSPITNIISVGASDNQDNPASFSNYGNESVDVFAPGTLILSLYKKDPKTANDNGRYATMSGTSMAAPYVSGIAALMISVNPKFRKNPELIIKTLINTSDKKQSLLGKSVSNGRVNVYRALSETTTKQPVTKTFTWKEESHSYNQRGYVSELVDIRHKIERPDATAIKIHFNFIKISEPYTSIYIYDKDLRLIDHVPFTSSVDYWSPIIPGNIAYVRYVNSIVIVSNFAMSKKGKAKWTCEQVATGEITKGSDGRYSCVIDSPDYVEHSSPTSNGGSSSGQGFLYLDSLGFEIDRISTTKDYKLLKINSSHEPENKNEL